MIQTQDLQTLYDGLIAVETKGDSTRTMANCLNYLLDLIRKSQQEQVVPPVPSPPVPVAEEPVEMPAEPVVNVVDSDQAAE